jgi:hypothetical protein
MKTASGITGPNCDINTKQECYHDTATLGQWLPSVFWLKPPSPN